MSHSRVSRRVLLQWGAGLSVAGAMAGCATAATSSVAAAPKMRVLAISDLHSSYGKIAQLLAAFRAEVANSDVPHLIVVNGDSFEKGNVVSVRSEGEIDWAFMAELPKIAPTVFNIGNHDNDLVYDLNPVIARMQSLGLTVVTNIVDARTGLPYAPAMTTMKVGDQTVQIVGIGTNSINTYPAESRAWLTLSEPVAWAKSNLPDAFTRPGLQLVLSHVGVVDERQYLSLLPQGALMVGGHNHLLFSHQDGRTGYVHPGRWGETYAVAEYGADGAVSTGVVTLDTDAQADPALQALVAATLQQHLTAQERAILGHNPQALTLGDTGRAIGRGFAEAVGADYGFIGLTTLGTGLKGGDVDQFHFDEVVRFDGKLMVAEVDAARLPAILKLSNQDAPISIQEMTGDYLFGAPRGDWVAGAATIKLVTTDWCARNQAKYFGTTDLVFVDVDTDGVKAVAQKALLG